MNVVVIGLGLIGGSFALAIKNQMAEATVFGMDQSEAHVEKAKALGLIDEKTTFEKLDQADVVIMAIPVDASISLLKKVLAKISEKTLVFDTGSTKSAVCKALSENPMRRNFLAAHPIAGTEFSGPEAALPDFFRGKTNIICEIEKTAIKLQEKAFLIFEALGMHIRYMDPEAHDRHIAYVSHLSHISSFMLGKTVLEKEKNEKDIFDLAGSGFASTVRLAKSSPAMWTPIFKENKVHVLETLNEYIANLNQFRTLMENDDFEQIFAEMQEINHIKTILNGIQ